MKQRGSVALALSWLFGGLRGDEIVRLRVGCIRWHAVERAPTGPDAPAEAAVCVLDMPVHKTGTAFAKPVDAVMGQAIEAGQAVRPDPPRRIDTKTGDAVDVLFFYRASPRRYPGHP